MDKIKEKLFKLQDKKYREMQTKIIPNINPDTIIGVRTPELKKFAKELIKSGEYSSFIEELPHKYFDENQLHAFIISEEKDYDKCLDYFNKFLPFIDNWATCDQATPKGFLKNADKLIDYIKVWIKSDEPYTIRFGIGMLMRLYLDENFKEEYLKWVSQIKSSEYYVNMMIAWYFATALAKQYDKTIKYIENNKLDVWTHNKAIQKAIESYRVSDEHKDYLRKLKRK
ncbi:MAG: DNA alkylation repair protein [Bacilli bacterium]|nr:DNA alkylation repair protein [Bacilli bacterium]